MAFADVEIRILKADNGYYPVEITVDSERQFPRGKLDVDLENQPATPTDALYADPEYGQKLFNWFFTDTQLVENWAEIRGAYPQRRVRLRIDADEPKLHQVPWEAFCEPKAAQQPALHLAAHSATPFSRYLASKTVHGTPVFKRPIRILMVVPKQDNFTQKYVDDPDLVLLEPDAEYQVLCQAIQPLINDQRIQLDLLPQPCTLAAIASTLSAARAEGKGYHVLHFVCHGFYKDGKASLVLSDANNQVQEEADDQIAGVLAHQLVDEDSLRLVFLASCESAKRSSADAYRGLAPKLVAAGVPAVVAMQNQVSPATAQQFAQKFYAQLLQHGQVDLAANEARQVLMAANQPGLVIPVLFLRLRTGNLLGQRGVIQSRSGPDFWPFLLGNIEAGFCTVFIGPHMNAGLLAEPMTVAKGLAAKVGYPLLDNMKLAKVAQYYMSQQQPKLLRKRYLDSLIESLPGYLDRKLTQQERADIEAKSLSEVIDRLGWHDSVLSVNENEPYHLLAELPIGLYITTNVDSFMYTTLKQHKPNARREQPRWEQKGIGNPQYELPFGVKEPVVFHLNGSDEDSDHIVLAEDELISHLVGLAHGDQNGLFPSNWLTALAAHSLIFIGFKFDDWELREILQGLMKNIKQKQENPVRHVGVQLSVDLQFDVGQTVEGNEKHAKQIKAQVERYLERSLDRFQIDIYWGETHQFVADLHNRWKIYEETEGNEWG